MTPFFPNARPFLLDSPQKGTLRVVFSRNPSNWLVTAWDAECSLQPLNTDVRGKMLKNAWQMAHSNDVRGFILQETTVYSCSFAGDFCHIEQDSKS